MPVPGTGNEIASVASAMPYTQNGDFESSPWRAPASLNASTEAVSIGSAPLSAMRHAERSMPSSRRIARAASAYAKFGPAVTVPRYSDIHRIQSAGAARKSCGGAIARSKPVSIGVMSSPMRPMSW